MRLQLRSRHVLVTGGSRGIGRATALAAARLGARVSVHASARADAAAEVVGAIRAEGGAAAAMLADLGRSDGAVRLVEDAVRAHGPLDGLVVNHGVWRRAPLAEMTADAWDDMLAVNLRSAQEVCRAALPHLRPGASVVLVASTAGQRGEAFHSHYAASKGGVIALARSLAAELRPQVRVNAVAPGWVLTDMTRDALAGEGGEDARTTIPIGRAARPEEIAGPIVFLLSDASSALVGEVLAVNGGAVTSP